MGSFMRTWVRLLFALSLTASLSSGSPVNSTTDSSDRVVVTLPDHTVGVEERSNCFPGIGFRMPNEPPTTLDRWWCSWDSEYAFVGFSYEVSECQSFDKLKREFTDIRQRFRGRYVRIYGACDRKGFNDDVINAAWQAGIGVHVLIWFGFDGTSEWKTRRDVLISTLHTNRLAKFVVRALQFGSEPLFDDVLSPSELAQQVRKAKTSVATLQIAVTVSDMAYSYQKNGGAPDVLEAIDIIDAHTLPFFARDASIAKDAWPIVLRDLKWFNQNGRGKKMYLSENGWPSKTSSGVQPNSDKAVANVQNEHDYYNLLDAHCSDFKAAPSGGIGWFAHIYSDTQEPGYGIYDTRGNLKFPFSPRVTC